MTRARTFLAAATCATAALCTTALGAQESIEDLAPSSSFFVVGTQNMKATLDHLKTNPLWQMLQARELQELVGQQIEQAEMMRGVIEQELQLDEGELAFPNGAVGAAAFMTDDTERGVKVLGMMGVARFTDQQDMLEKVIDGIIEQADLNGAPYEAFELAGRTVYAIDLADAAPAEAAEVPANPMAPEAMLKPYLDSFKRLYISRSDDTLLVSTSQPTLVDAFAALDGNDIDNVADNITYQQAIDQVGTGDGHAVVLVDEMLGTLGMQPMLMMSTPMLAGPMKALGLSNIEAFSSSFDLADEGTVMSQTSGILVEGEKTGLLGLIQNSAPVATPPSFVKAGASGYTRMSMNLGGMMDVVNRLVASIPPQFRQDAEGLLFQFGPDLNAFFSSMGNEIHSVSGTTPEDMMYAFQVTQADKLESVVAKYAPQLGLEARDFAGNTIFGGDFAPMSIGLGKGFMFIGGNTAVEDALRMAGMDAPASGNDPVFTAVRRHIGDEQVAMWSFTDTEDMLEGLRQTMQNPMMNPMGQGAEMPDLEFITRYVGPSAWTMQSVESGFLIRSFTLPPVDAEQ